MNIGILGSVINLFCVIGFAFCLLIGASIGNYLFGMFIAFSFVIMVSSFVVHSKPENKAAGYISMIFSGIYAVFILLVYFAQITTVRLVLLNEQAAQIISSQKFGLFFNYDLLGYGVMALSTFFIGLTIDGKVGIDKYLKWLLLIHGIFFISSFILPILGIFSADAEQSNKIGPIIQTFWCTYFSIISILSIIHFKNKRIKNV
jgi:hypothetical protein